VPQPPPPKRKNIPAALEGDQYELWDIEDQPLPSALIAAQPKYIAVTCRKCQTLMYATERQVGQSIACPDCSTRHVVPPPPTQKSERFALASDAETPQLDPAAHPGERPPVIIPPRRRMEYEQEEEAKYERALAESRRTGKPMKIDVRGRPVMPRWPLLVGILPFFFSAGVAERWLALSFGYCAAGYLISEGLIWGGLGGLATMSALMFFIAGMILCLVLTAAGSGMFRAVVIESSEGNDRVEDWGTRYIADWFSDLLYLVMALFASVFPGWAIARLATQDIAILALASAASAAVWFPLVYLSQLQIDSPWGVLLGRVVASVGRYPGSWLLFYLETGFLWALCLAAVVATVLLQWHPVAPIPICLAAAVVFARLLGRLAWKLAESLPDDAS
jgi:hypothetical protein